MGFLLKQRRCDLVCVHPSQLRPFSHMQVPPAWEHILYVYQLPTRGVQVPPQREHTTQSVQTHVRDVYLFLNHGPWSFP